MTAIVLVSEPPSSSVTVTLTISTSDAVPLGASSAHVQSKEPLFEFGRKVLPETTPVAPQLTVRVQVSAPGSVQPKV